MTSSTSSTNRATRVETPASDFLDRAFPFHLLVSRDLELIEIGASLGRVMPTLVPGTHLGSHFEITRPFAMPVTPDALRRVDGEVTVLQHRGGLALQGDVMETELGFLFLSAPIVGDLSTLADMGLTLRDFPPHDVTGDFLLLLQSTRTTMRSLEKASSSLLRQRLDLELAHSRLEASLVEAVANKAALAVTEQQYREVVDTVREVIFRASPSGRFTFLNAAWEVTTGFTAAEALNHLVTEYIHPDDRNMLRAVFASEASLGTIQARMLVRGGATRWVELRLERHEGTDGSRDHIGVFVDVTLQHEARLKLEEGQLRLTEAKQIAEEANQAKSDWLAAMSHEIRTPLHVLLGMAELLRETPLNMNQENLLVHVEANANHLNQLLASLLDLEKIEQGQFDEQSVRFSPQQILSEASQLVRTRLGNTNIEVRTTLDPSLPGQLLGDVSRIRQVLFNLASNAAKFTENGEVALNARGQDGQDGRFRLHIDVADTGVGIPATDQRHVFERHFRASNANRVDGTGLGLHISRTITEQLGGSLVFTSAEGQGTVFSMAVPCTIDSTSPDRALETAAAPASLTPAATSTGRPSRVMVVEDFPPSQKLAMGVLTRAGHAVDVVGTAAEAVALAARHRYDVILMDLQLPDFSGVDASRLIRAAEERLHETPVPIVALTAHALEGHREQCAAAGMSDFAAKPVNAAGLRHLVQRWSDTRKTALLVDDSPDCLTLYTGFLNHADVRTVAVTSGVDALVQLGRQPIDFVLLDMNMPNLSGYDTARQIRRDRRLSALPIVACTGDDSRLSRQRAIEAGCNDVLVKPLSRPTLLTAINRLLEPDVPGPAPSLPELLFAIPPELADAVPAYLDGIIVDLAPCLADLDSSRFDRVESVAHNVKGTGTSFGFPDLTRLARELESAATSRDLTRSRPALDQLCEHLRQVRAAVQSGAL